MIGRSMSDLAVMLLVSLLVVLLFLSGRCTYVRGIWEIVSSSIKDLPIFGDITFEQSYRSAIQSVMYGKKTAGGCTGNIAL